MILVPLNSLNGSIGKILHQFEFNKAVVVHSIFENGNAPCLRQQFSVRNNNTNDYNLRNYGTDLSIPKPKKEFLKRSFKYRGAVLWNNLPYQVKSAPSMYAFKRIIHAGL